MKKSIKITLIIFLLAAVLGKSYGQHIAAKMDSILSSHFASNAPGVAALVAQKGNVIYRSARGMASLELNVPMAPGHVFRIGSITKQFTAIAILKLVDEGRLSLNDDIRKFFPAFKSDSAVVTIEHLLTHTSGLGNQRDIENWDQLIKEIENVPNDLTDIILDRSAVSDPGSKYSYSNFGYMLLGNIIEQVSGQAYGDFLTSEILEPLNLNKTTYDHSEKIMGGRVQGYSKSREEFQNAENLDMRIPYAGGGLISTVDDLYAWNRYLYADQSLIKAEILKRAHSRFRLIDGQSTAYGYGWMLGSIQGRKTIKHDGIINGFISFALYLPEDEIFVALLTNCDCTRNIEKLASKLAATAMVDHFDYHPIEVKQETLIKYTGVYRSNDGSEKWISLQDGSLVLHDKGGIKTKITPVVEDRFAIDEGLSSVEFYHDDNNGTPHFLLDNLGDSSRWEKISDEIFVLNTMVLSQEQLQKFVGKYNFEGAFTLEIFIEEGRIFGKVGGDAKEISPYGPDRCFVLEMDARLIFDIGDSGIVSGLTFMQSREMKGRKIE